MFEDRKYENNTPGTIELINSGFPPGAGYLQGKWDKPTCCDVNDMLPTFNIKPTKLSLTCPSVLSKVFVLRHKTCK
jgi:hypothetical protein